MVDLYALLVEHLFREAVGVALAESSPHWKTQTARSLACVRRDATRRRIWRSMTKILGGATDDVEEQWWRETAPRERAIDAIAVEVSTEALRHWNALHGDPQSISARDEAPTFAEAALVYELGGLITATFHDLGGADGVVLVSLDLFEQFRDVNCGPTRWWVMPRRALTGAL